MYFMQWEIYEGRISSCGRRGTFSSFCLNKTETTRVSSSVKIIRMQFQSGLGTDIIFIFGIKYWNFLIVEIGLPGIFFETGILSICSMLTSLKEAMVKKSSEMLFYKFINNFIDIQLIQPILSNDIYRLTTPSIDRI